MDPFKATLILTTHNDFKQYHHKEIDKKSTVESRYLRTGYSNTHPIEKGS